MRFWIRFIDHADHESTIFSNLHTDEAHFVIARELSDNRVLLVTQESHADLAAQFASHWGNTRFARLEPYDTMVFAAIYHDSHFREVEADLPINLEKGWPHGHRTTPFSLNRIDALQQNIDWIESRDPYAGLIVSMHHTGLAQNRYGVVNSWQTTVGTSTPKRPMRPEVQTMVRKLEERQRVLIKELNKQDSEAGAKIQFNYHLFQVFDLLSLYFCVDGHGDEGMKEETIGPIPLAFGSEEKTNLHIAPVGTDSVRIDPYPFDSNSLKVSLFGRVMGAVEGKSEEKCRAEFYMAERECFTWTIVK